MVFVNIMNDDESGQKKEDYVEIEFELGDLEFEAKGSSAVVERLFNLLIDKIESGAIEIGEYEDEEEEFEDEEEEDSEDLREIEEPEKDPDPPPEWDTFEEEPPEITDTEKEAFDIE